MHPGEEDIIRRWHEGLDGDIRLALFVTEDPRSEKLADFCNRLTSLAPRVSVEKKKRDAEDPPFIEVMPNYRHHGVPQAKELTPFLEAVSVAAGERDAELDNGADIERIEIPAGLSLYVAPTCAHCPAMVRRLGALAATSDKVRLSIIDAALFREIAEKEKIRSVPTVVLDGTFRFNGVVPIAEIVQMLASRNPADIGPSVLLGLIEEGNAEEVADLMLSHRLVFPALIDLLTDEKWPRRLGAMVALETAAETDPDLAAEAIPALVKRMEKVSDPVKGDILYLLGEIGGADIAPFLKRFAETGGSHELTEAAAEALERVRSK